MARPSPLRASASAARRVLLLLPAVLVTAAAEAPPPHPLRLVAPADDHTKLAVDREGLEVLRRSPDGVPVSLVSVIGPYRSGKSYLLNRLLGVGCDEGFGVGHRRETQTKGAWIWSEGITQSEDGPTNVFFIDTEGFESAGRASTYDDRLFAFAASVSAVLVYNLPESVREGDILKLSFAMELANEFAKAKDAKESENGKAFPPGALYWLIQRDFLEGSTVQEAVDGALAEHANSDNNRDIAQLNNVRKGLRDLGWEHIGRGLRQPHVDRTKLCDLNDDALDATYVSQLASFRKEVRARAVRSPRKLGTGEGVMDGKALAALIERIVAALSDAELPSWSRNLVEAYNYELVEACSDGFQAAVRGAGGFPMGEAELAARIDSAVDSAVNTCYLSRRFGAGDVSPRLLQRIEEQAGAAREHNQVESTSACERAAGECENAIGRLSSGSVLLSKVRFDAGFAACKSLAFDVQCKGPRRAYHEQRLEERRRDARSHMLDTYKDMLFGRVLGLLGFTAVLGRCVWHSFIVEALAWVTCCALWAYPHVAGMAGFAAALGAVGEGGLPSLYETRAWGVVTMVWEAFAAHVALASASLALLVLLSRRALLLRLLASSGCFRVSAASRVARACGPRKSRRANV